MTQLRFLVRLVFSQMRLHPGRAVVTTLGIVASTCAVVWVVSGYDALVSQFDENAGKYLGRYDALIIPQSGPPGTPTPPIDETLIEQLADDAGVLEVNPVSNSRVSATKANRSANENAPVNSLDLLVGDVPLSTEHHRSAPRLSVHPPPKRRTSWSMVSGCPTTVNRPRPSLVKTSRKTSNCRSATRSWSRRSATEWH
ncbi:ABC transporter integral membrane protein [Rhodopirellula sallentina SM41]|uniref:ABC transporter integral membrane protein n=1 Tax=Rhodopirellula sallentina SM41 TaxID=1263870 RepID=M5UA59_9BACT|nr:ABC transporter integral membrane protein [Rhodopirellula sallentina SM41]